MLKEITPEKYAAMVVANEKTREIALENLRKHSDLIDSLGTRVKGGQYARYWTKTLKDINTELGLFYVDMNKRGMKTECALEIQNLLKEINKGENK